MIKAVIQGIPVIINDHEWTSTDKDLERLLNSMIDPAGPSGADPYPDKTYAMEAIEALGGRIVEASPPDHPPPGVIS